MTDCDFIPAPYHEQQMLRRSIKLRVYCVAGLLVIMAAWFAAHQGRISSAEAMLTETALQKDQVRIHADKQRLMESERGRLDDRRRLLEELSDSASLVLVLSDLSRRMPEHVILTRLSVRSPSVSQFVVKDLAVADRHSSRRGPGVAAAVDAADSRPVSRFPRLEMTGIAVSLPDMIRFAGAMEDSALVQRVDMKVREPTVWGGRRVEQFTLMCELVAQDGSRP